MLVLSFVAFAPDDSRAVDAGLHSLARYTALTVAGRLDAAMAALRAMAADPILRDPGAPAAMREERLSFYRGVFLQFEGFALAGGDGAWLAVTGPVPAGSATVQAALREARAGNPVISPPAELPEPRRAAVWVAIPVHSEAGGVWAAAAGQLPVAALTGELVPSGPGGYSALVGSGGAVLAEGGVRPAGGLQAGSRAATAAVPSRLLAEPWTIQVAMPADLAGGQRTTLLYWAFAAAGLVAVLLLAVAVPLAGALLQPLSATALAAREVATGKFSRRVPDAGNDEVAELARAFNTMADQLQARVLQLESSRHRLVTVQESIRRRLAEQLHGPVQTKLLVLWYRLADCLQAIRTNPDEAEALLQQVREELDQLREEDVRGISHQLHPAIVQLGLAPALRSLRDRFENVLPVELALDESVERGERPLRQEAVLAAYRAAEEALTNVVKHAGPARARVEARLTAGPRSQLKVLVQDTGQGFWMPADRPGLGITTMQDYIAALGGTLLVESQPGQGTRVTVTLPLEATRPAGSGPGLSEYPAG